MGDLHTTARERKRQKEQASIGKHTLSNSASNLSNKSNSNSISALTESSYNPLTYSPLGDAEMNPNLRDDLAALKGYSIKMAVDQTKLLLNERADYPNGAVQYIRDFDSVFQDSFCVST